MIEVPIIQKPVMNLQSKSLDWFLYDSHFRHERATAKKRNVCKKIHTKTKSKCKKTCFIYKYILMVVLWGIATVYPNFASNNIKGN